MNDSDLLESPPSKKIKTLFDKPCDEPVKSPLPKESNSNDNEKVLFSFLRKNKIEWSRPGSLFEKFCTEWPTVMFE